MDGIKLYFYGTLETQKQVNKPAGIIEGPAISGDTIDYKNNRILVCAYQEKDPIQIFDYNKREFLYDIKYHSEDEVMLIE